MLSSKQSIWFQCHKMISDDRSQCQAIVPQATHETHKPTKSQAQQKEYLQLFILTSVKSIEEIPAAKMVLWKKESTSPNACYIDLLFKQTTDGFDYQITKMMCERKNKKCDSKSAALRMHGNQKFRANEWMEAMHLYNQSLRYASVGSENMSMAYANRSTCFMQLKKYEQCLVDIELARKANYPERLMHKLVEREAKCLQLMNDESMMTTEETTELALSFDANVKFPCLANALKIQYNEKLGEHHMVATRDIDVGHIILAEELLFTSTHCQTQTFCKTCLKSAMNFVPCHNCVEFMFCDAKCMDTNGMHKMSCNVLHDQDQFDSVRLVESVLIAVAAFQSTGSLMEFVECALSTRNFDVPKCSSDTQAKYSMFLKLKLTVSPEVITGKMKSVVFWVYHMLLDLPEIKRSIQSKREKRFLMHLILQHHLILISNGTLFHQTDEDGNKTYEASGIGVFTSLISFACVANATFQRHGNQMFVYALRPIKKGEPVTIDNAKSQPDERCKCSKCRPKWKRAVSKRFQSEPNYKFLMQHHTDHVKEPETRRMIMAKMQQLLQTYGRLPWMPEFEAMTMLYDHCVHAEYAI